MKNIFVKNRKFYSRGILLLSALVLILVGCVYIDRVSVMQIQEDGTQAPISKAGSIATFTVDGNINCQENTKDVRFVVSFLAPKSWNVRKHAKVTYVTTLNTDPDQELNMSPVPDSSLPKEGGGRTWGEVLMQENGVGPNVLHDMEWVTFQTDDKWAIYNGDKPSYTIYIKTNVGEQNLKAYLGFFVGHTDDGMDPGKSDHRKVKYSDEPFEVIEGKGLTIDYSTDHFNKVQPLATLQDDLVTFSFNGGIYENDLVSSNEIYAEFIAYDVAGNIISELTEKSSKTLLNRESGGSQTFSRTVWIADYFNVPEGVSLDHIEYVFTNKDRSVIITQTDDDAAVEGKNIDDISEKEPFVFELVCD